MWRRNFNVYVRYKCALYPLRFLLKDNFSSENIFVNKNDRSSARSSFLMKQDTIKID